MNSWIVKILFVIVSIVVVNKASLATLADNEAGQQSWKFKVMLDDKPIGFHQVSINRDENRKSVHTTANFDVRLFYIPVYSYDHETREQWQDGCLVDITSMTDDNGDDYFIKTQSGAKQLSLQTQDGTTSLGGCVRTFAYWDIDLLRSERLLNTQTGEYQTVEITDLGTGTLVLQQGEIDARHFRLVAEDMTIDLWYTQHMRWLALESMTESGAILRYLPAQADNITLEARL